MRVLITGSTGFIGKHTRSALQERGHKAFPFKGDVRKVGDWEENLKKGVDVVVHLVAIRTETKKDFEVNTKGTKNFFKAAQKLSQRPKKFVLASSQAVYIGLKPPFKEDMSVRALTTYSKSKFQAEKIAQRLGRRLGIRVVILRYSTVLGLGIRGRSNMSGPLYAWVKKALNQEDINVFGDGKQTRDYIHVKDVARANVLVAEKDMEGIFNLGGGRKVSLLTLAKLVKDATNSKSRIVVTKKFYKDDPRHLFSDTLKLRSLGWKPKETIKKAVYEFVKNPKE